MLVVGSPSGQIANPGAVSSLAGCGRDPGPELGIPGPPKGSGGAPRGRGAVARGDYFFRGAQGTGRAGPRKPQEAAQVLPVRKQMRKGLIKRPNKGQRAPSYSPAAVQA